jgi:hypothetical protein
MRLPLVRHRSRSVHARRAPGLAARVTLRLATSADDEGIARLAALYDRRLPSGPLLLAEVDGELQAALTLTSAEELMEPYLPTAALVELLALRVQHLRDQMTPAELAEANAAVRGDPALGWRRRRRPGRGATRAQADRLSLSSTCSPCSSSVSGSRFTGVPRRSGRDRPGQ